MAFMQTDCTDCRGYKQWQEVGRQVKKGSKAAYILGPRLVKIEDEETGEEKQIVTGFFSIPVFPYDDTEGESLIEEDQTPREMPPLYDVAQAWGINIDYCPLPQGVRGSFNPGKNSIKLGTANVKTFFHELAHAAHGKIEALNHGQDSKQETIAEFTACVLMKLYTGEDYSGNSWQYIESYNPNDPIKAIYSVLSTVEQVINLIIESEVVYA
jgi:hypothetical protein